MKQYCIYLRKSRADAEAEAQGEGETLARHETALLALAKRLNHHITSIYREIVSGETISARPVMQQLLAEVEKGIWDGVLVMEVERLARGDTIDQGVIARAFLLSHTKIITPAKTYDPDNEFDEEYFEFGLFMSRREYKTINRRLQRGREASAMEGKYIGSVPPYGYTRVKLPAQKGYSLTPNPDTAPIIELIFELYTRGELLPDGSVQRLGVARLARKLNALGIKPQKSTVWTTSNLQPILRNPVYAGKIRWQGRPAVKTVKDGNLTVFRPRMREEECTIVDGLHPPLIDPDTWNTAQEYLAAGHPRGTRSETLKNPLAGLVFCGICGRRMFRKPLSDRSLETLMCPNPECTNVSAELHLIETRVLEALETWLHGYKVSIDASDVSGYAKFELAAQSALNRIEDDMSMLTEQSSSIHDLLEQGVYTVEVFLDRQKALVSKAADLEQARETARLELHAIQTQRERQQTTLPHVETVLASYAQAASIQAKNDLLKSVIERIEYTKAVRGGNGQARQRKNAFELVLHPKLPNLPSVKGQYCGTEELAHWEMIGTMIHQCMRGATIAGIRAAGMEGFYTLHDCGLFPCDPNGVPFTTAYIACTGDPVADLTEDMAAEQKARTAYEHLITLTDDPDVKSPLLFLREREVVHFQRFGEALNIVQGNIASKKKLCNTTMCHTNCW